MLDKDNIDISVHTITYGHENFIDETIKGVLMQEGNFSMEHVIAEDSGPDRTREICKSYADKHPNIIRLLPNTGNLGIQKNFLYALEECKGKYIAFCEGDDFWTNKNKLQEQFDFLEQNPEYFGIAHNANALYNNWNSPYKMQQANLTNTSVEKLTGVQGTFNGDKDSCDIDFHELLDAWPIQTGTFMCRNIPLSEYPDFIDQTIHVDLMLFFAMLKKGKIRYENKILSTYRMHEDGATNKFQNGTAYYFNRIKSYQSLKRFFGNKHIKRFNEKLVDSNIQIAIISTEKREKLSAMISAIKLMPSILISKFRILASLTIKLFF